MKNCQNPLPGIKLYNIYVITVRFFSLSSNEYHHKGVMWAEVHAIITSQLAAQPTRKRC